MEKGKKENKFVVVVLFLISFVLIAGSVFLIFNSMNKRPLQSVEYDVFFIIGDRGSIGVDVNNSLLTFGRTFPGGPGVTRPVLITNDYNFPILVEVFISENVANVLELNFSYDVESAKNLSIPIRLAVPEDYPLGNYTGKIRFDLYRLEE